MGIPTTSTNLNWWVELNPGFWLPSTASQLFGCKIVKSLSKSSPNQQGNSNSERHNWCDPCVGTYTWMSLWSRKCHRIKGEGEVGSVGEKFHPDKKKKQLYVGYKQPIDPIPMDPITSLPRLNQLRSLFLKGWLDPFFVGPSIQKQGVPFKVLRTLLCVLVLKLMEARNWWVSCVLRII